MTTQSNGGVPRPVFKCLESVNEIADGLSVRIAEPEKINQNGSPLCGPAAFMFCIAKGFPFIYSSYVQDLARNGEARIGNLHIKPSQACRDVTLAELSQMRIEPVDWIALASLRDSSNSILPVTAGSSAAGITTPVGLAEWFSATGLFPNGVGSKASVVSSKGIDELIAANHQYRTGAYVCLMVRAAIVGGGGGIGMDKIGKNTPKTLLGTPDHWIVMTSEMRLGKPPKNVMPPSITYPRQDHLEREPLAFQAFTWGEVRPVSRAQAQEFLPYFYGYVSATV